MADERVSRNLRLPTETAQEVEIVARIDGMSGNELITVATEEYLTRRGNSKAFRKRLAERHESERELYERLARN